MLDFYALLKVIDGKELELNLVKNLGRNFTKTTRHLLYLSNVFICEKEVEKRVNSKNT